MKRIFILFILFVLLLPLILLPISAEESGKTEVTLFKNGKYTIEITLEFINEEACEKIKNIFAKHTGVSYEKKNINNNTNLCLITTENSSKAALNKITYNVTSNLLILNYDTEENLDILLTELSEKLQTLPRDKIVLDQSFLVIEKTSTVREEKEESFWDKAVNFFENTGKLVNGFLNLFDFSSNKNSNTLDTLTNGGFNFIKENSRLNLLISVIYETLYPVGFIIMLLCWGFGVAKNSISSSLDIKDKNSIIYAIFSLMLGLGAITLAPQILTSLTGVSQWLCKSVDAANYITWDNWDIVTDINVIEIISNSVSNLSAALLVIVIIKYVFLINILWIALLQCLSPIFIGLMANRGTRKISFNFIKEYIKALLVPVVTLIYYKLVSGLLWDLDPTQTTNNYIGSFGVGLIGALVLAIATVSIAGKKLDKLIN